MNEVKERKSKSQVKRELLALQELGRELVELPQTLLEQVPLTDELQHAVVKARGFKREALRRQIQHIGGLMRHADEQAIRQALVSLKKPHQAQVKVFHEIESWRDRLLQGDNEVMTELCQRFSDIDRRHVRQLLRNAIKEREQGRAPKSARALFRYLSQLAKSKNS